MRPPSAEPSESALAGDIPNGSLDLLSVHAGEHALSGIRSNKIANTLLWFLPMKMLGTWAAYEQGDYYVLS